MSTNPIGLSVMACAAGLFLVSMFMSSCAPSTETLVKGDRDVIQVAAGVFKTGSGDARNYYIIRDPDTGTDYLAVVDAGIIELKPKPALTVEKR